MSTRATAGQFKGQFSGAMERYTGFDSRESSPPAKETHGNSQHTSGAMERFTWVRFAGKLTPCHTQIWRRSAHQWGDGTLQWVQICGKAYNLPDNAHSNRQHFSGAMERYTWVRFARKLTSCHIAHSKGQHSSGAIRWLTPPST